MKGTLLKCPNTLLTWLIGTITEPKRRHGEAPVDELPGRLLNVIQQKSFVEIPEKFVTRTPVDAATYRTDRRNVSMLHTQP